MLSRLLRRWADSRLSCELDRLRDENRTAREHIQVLESKLRIAECELKELAAVIARNIKRVEAETAAAAAKIVEAE